MITERRRIANDVAEKLFSAETALDIAAARIAELTAALPLARLEARLAASVGHDALRSASAALVLITRTREEIISTHSSLKHTSDRIGLGAVSYGDLTKLEGSATTPTGTLLRAV